LSVGSVIEAIKKLDKQQIKSSDCIKHANKFNKNRFKREITGFIEKIIK